MEMECEISGTLRFNKKTRVDFISGDPNEWRRVLIENAYDFLKAVNAIPAVNYHFGPLSIGDLHFEFNAVAD